MIKDFREMYRTLGGFYTTVVITTVVVAIATTSTWVIDVITRML